jgi:hypothetical protein
VIQRSDIDRALERCASRVAVRGTGDDASLPRDGDATTWPNVVSIAGYFAAIAYLEGASPWWAIASIAADEIDGRLARATQQTSELGSQLDWGIDVTLTGLFADRLGVLWLLPAVTGAQAYLRSRGTRPTMLSGRALMMLLALWRTGFGRLPTHAPAIVIVEAERARAVGQAPAASRTFDARGRMRL